MAYANNIAEIVRENVTPFLKKESILRKGKIYKLQLGEVGVFDTLVGSWSTRIDSGEFKRVYNARERFMVDTHPISIRFRLRDDELDHIAYHATRAIKNFMKQEEATLAQFIYGATIFVPRESVERTQTLFDNLGRPGVVAAEEDKTPGALKDWSKKLVTTIRTDLSVKYLYEPHRMSAIIAMWEDIGWWVPSNKWLYENRTHRKNGGL